MDCLFCKIVRKEIPADILYEDDLCIAIFDISPANFGHILVLSKEHYETAIDLPCEKFASLMKRVSILSKAMKEPLR